MKYHKTLPLILFLFVGCFVLTNQAQAAVRTWDGGGGDNNWSTAANWSGDVAPGASDTVTFDATSTKDSIWDSSGPATIAGFTATAAYSGAFSITKASVACTGNWSWAGIGTFSAGSGTITFSTNNITFTPGSASYNNVTVNIANGTFAVSGGAATVLGNLDFATSDYSTNFTGTINVSGNLLRSGNSASWISGSGVVQVVGTGSQTISSSGGGSFGNITVNKSSGTVILSGTITVFGGSWTWTAGSLNAGSSTLYFGTNDVTFTPGNVQYNNVTVNIRNGNFTVSGGAAAVLGNLDFATSDYSTNFTGTINVSGNLLRSGNSASWISGSGVVQVVGTGSQTISSSGGGSFGYITVNKPSGVVTLSGTIPIFTDWTWTAGSLAPGSGTLKFAPNASTRNFTPGNVVYNNLTIGCDNSTFNVLGGTATVAGTFDIASSTNSTTLSGTIAVLGTITHSGAADILGGTIQVIGTSDQTLSSSGGGSFGPITVNKPAGTLILSGTIPVRGNWTWTAGVLNAGTSTLQFPTTGTFTPGSRTTYYNISISGGVLTTTLAGNLVVSNNITVNGNTLTTSGSNYSITTKDLTLTSGTLTANASIIKVSGNLTGAGTFTQGTSTVVLNGTGQTVSGTRTFYNLYKMLPNTTTDTLTFTAGTTYTIASGGTARFMGTRGYPLSIQSSSAGSAFTLTKTGSVIAEYVSLKDSTISGSTSAVASTSVSGNTSWVFTKEFVSTIRATGGDYTTLSGWEGALGAVDLTASATKVFSHSGITGTIADNSSVTGATSGATGTVIHSTSTQILIKSISGTFQSGEQIRVNVSNYVTTTDAGNGAIAVAECYNDWPNALNDSVTISGETTDADNFILVVAPFGQRHMGKLKDTNSSYYNGFTLKPSSSTAIVLDNQMSYTRIEGIAIDGTNATATNFRLNGTSPLGVRLLSANGVDGFSLSGGALVTNSLAYGGTGKCFEDTTAATTNYTVYNSTAYGCAYGFQGNNTTTAITLKNVLASNNSTADYALTNSGAKSVTYSASSDATSDDYAPATGDRVSQTFSFVDTVNKDYHLLKKDTGGKNFGLDLSTDTTYPIIDDIESDVRPAVNPSDTSEVSYDMGMDEYDYDVTQFKKGVRWR